MLTTTGPVTESVQSRDRVLVICNDSDYFLRHRLSVVTHLSSIGVETAVMAGGVPIAASRIDGWKYIHIPIERFRFDPFGDAGLMIQTARTIWRLRPDAVHLITLKPTIFCGFVSIVSRLFHGYPKRILITLPGLGRMLSPKAPGERRYLLANFLTRTALRALAASKRVHFTFETRHDYVFWAVKGVATPENSSVIDGVGVDPVLFYPAPDSRRRDKTQILFASRLLKSKGLNAFLMMARQLSDRPNVEFVVAGMADDKDPDAVSPQQLSQLNDIRFLGEVDNMPGLLRECDIVCLPTRYGEGIPRILIEAAASGLASIASDHPGCREAVEDGVTGEIVPISSDSDMCRDMSAAILKYLETPALLAAHKLAAYQRFKSREFNEKAVVARFVKLLGICPPQA
jgi:glycosyltransferase involved in cell wall biosynthesis